MLSLQCNGTSRPSRQLSAAVWTQKAKARVRAIKAERAFKAANVSFAGLGEQLPVAAFTIRSQFKRHGFDPSRFLLLLES
jgi:hypothetical protein